MFERFIRWLFPTLYRAHFEALHKIREDLAVLLAGMRRIESTPPRNSRRVYVTLRGFYKTPGNGKLVAHGWTQAVTIAEDQECSLSFEPYNMFETERVDVLGPAVILGANVGNQCQELPKFEAPTTFEFRASVDVGNRVAVRLKGIP